MAVTVEKFDSLNKDDNRYNRDNHIYRVGKKFTYTYSYRDKAGISMVMTAADTGGQSEDNWQLVRANDKSAKSVTHVVLSVSSGLMPFIQVFPDYNQTVILYDFKLMSGNSWKNEMTGIIENSRNLWYIHHAPDSLEC